MSSSRWHLHQSVLLILGGMLGALLLAACLLHGLSRRGAERRHQEGRALAAASMVACQAGPLLLRRIDDPLHHWTRQMQARPGIRLVAVHDKQGQIRSIKAASAVLARQAVWSEGVMVAPYPPATWHLADGEGMRVCGATVPIFVDAAQPPVGHLTMAFDAGETTPAASSAWWGVYLPLAAVAVFLWWLGLRLTCKRVVDPFRELGSHIRRGGQDLPVDRDDPVGELARAFSKLHEQIDHWRGKSQKLRLNLEKKLETQSKDHLKDLGKAMRNAEMDSLTGLGNRRVVDSHLDRIVAEHLRRKADLAVVMLDVDNFKDFNDRLGHPAGDELLAFVGELLARCVRQEDLAIRYGGDEFMLILPGTSANEAAHMVQRLTALFGQIVKTLPRIKPAPSLSAGVVGLQTAGTTLGSELIVAADESLYQAKAAGRGRVVVAEPAPPPEDVAPAETTESSHPPTDPEKAPEPSPTRSK